MRPDVAARQRGELVALCRAVAIRVAADSREAESETEMTYPIGQYVIVRTESAGCFAAVLDEVDGKTARLSQARRLWYWKGAASLSELASRGTSNPAGCKFPAAVTSMVVRGWIEFIPMTEAAKLTIAAVPIWTE